MIFFRPWQALLTMLSLAIPSVLQAQTDYRVGDQPLATLEAPYVIVSFAQYLGYRTAIVDFGQDCRRYQGLFRMAERRERCDGLSQANGSPVDIHSLAQLLNLMASIGYELQRTIPDEIVQGEGFDPWEAQYVFRRQRRRGEP